MNLFQIDLLFLLPVHTYFPETQVIDRFLFVYKVPRVPFQHLCLRTKVDFFCVVLSFIIYWFGMVQRKLTIPEKWQA